MSHTPLTQAVASNDWVQYTILVDNGADVNECDSYGWAPIHLALQSDDPLIANEIIRERIFNVNCQRVVGKDSSYVRHSFQKTRNRERSLLAR